MFTEISSKSLKEELNEYKQIIDSYKGDEVDSILYNLFLECEHGEEGHKVWLLHKFKDFAKRYKEGLI